MSVQLIRALHLGWRYGLSFFDCRNSWSRGEWLIVGLIDMGKEKVVCSTYRCDWHGLEEEILKSPNPFEVGETLYACPKCKEVGSVVIACDESECWKGAMGGTP